MFSLINSVRIYTRETHYIRVIYRIHLGIPIAELHCKHHLAGTAVGSRMFSICLVSYIQFVSSLYANLAYR